MSTIQEIETAIEGLPHDQFLRLLTRIRGKFEVEWEEIDADVKSGKLQIANKARMKDRTARVFPIDE